MARKLRVIFRWTKYNHYSLSAIFGFLDDTLSEDKFDLMTGEDEKDISAKIETSQKPCIVAYSFASTEFEEVFREINSLKQVYKEKIVVICGGPHATALPESVLEAGADLVFVGEAEESLPDFLNRYYDCLKLPDDRIVASVVLKDFDNYSPFSYKRKFFGPIELRRGCSNSCVFCQTPKMFKKVSERSIKHVKKFVKYMKQANRARIIFTIPDVLSYGLAGNKVNLSHIETFLNEIRELDVQVLLGNFPSEIFPKKLADNPLAAVMLKKYITNKSIILGGQSASGRVLEIMKRNHSTGDIVESVRLLKEAGFMPIVDILFGISGETEFDRAETLGVMKTLSRQFSARFNVHYFMPLPGTPFYKMAPEVIEDETKNEIYAMMKNGVVHGSFFEQMNFCIENLKV